jgi:hypothetical protein
MLIARFNLLCDNCNWEFVGFALPGTTSAKRKRNTRKTSDAAGEDSAGAVETNAAAEDESRNSKRSSAAVSS